MVMTSSQRKSSDVILFVRQSDLNCNIFKLLFKKELKQSVFKNVYLLRHRSRCFRGVTYLVAGDVGSSINLVMLWKTASAFVCWIVYVCVTEKEQFQRNKNGIIVLHKTIILQGWIYTLSLGDYICTWR